MPSIGPLEIVVVLAIALLVFGPSRLPEMGRNVGRAMRQFQDFQHGVRGQIEDAFTGDDDDEQPTPSNLSTGSSPGENATSSDTVR